jgi:cytochrome b561
MTELNIGVMRSFLNVLNNVIHNKTWQRRVTGVAMYRVHEGKQMEQSQARYGTVAQVLHWVTAILVLVAFIYGPGGSEQHAYSHAHDFDRQLHETLGLCVFALALIRVLWLMFDKRPDPPQVSRWMGIAAKTIQGVLYLLLFALPITAIAGAWLEGHPLTLLAGLEIPSVIATSHDTGVSIAGIHTWLGDAILWLAGFHALAGIYHHLVLKDGVLASMLPRWLLR